MPKPRCGHRLGFFSLHEEPAILKALDFEGRFSLSTAHCAEIGKSYGSRPGFYLLVASNRDADVPESVTAALRCLTEFADVVPRVLLDDTPEKRNSTGKRDAKMGRSA